MSLPAALLLIATTAPTPPPGTCMQEKLDDFIYVQCRAAPIEDIASKIAEHSQWEVTVVNPSKCGPIDLYWAPDDAGRIANVVQYLTEVHNLSASGDINQKKLRLTCRPAER